MRGLLLVLMLAGAARADLAEDPRPTGPTGLPLPVPGRPNPLLPDDPADDKRLLALGVAALGAGVLAARRLSRPSGTA